MHRRNEGNGHFSKKMSLVTCLLNWHVICKYYVFQFILLSNSNTYWTHASGQPFWFYASLKNYMSSGNTYNFGENPDFHFWKSLGRILSPKNDHVRFLGNAVIFWYLISCNSLGIKPANAFGKTHGQILVTLTANDCGHDYSQGWQMTKDKCNPIKWLLLLSVDISDKKYTNLNTKELNYEKLLFNKQMYKWCGRR